MGRAMTSGGNGRRVGYGVRPSREPVAAGPVTETQVAGPEGAVGPRPRATIALDVRRRLGTVDPRIYGGFVENLGRCIYGGIFEEGSALSDERGFRRDVTDAIRRLHPPVMRWGGNFISGYHWTDGIGPRDQRPRRWDRAWQAEESNRFGTDEFIEFCRLIGAEPFICCNMGTGTLDEAMSWVEYCNGRGATEWAERRRRNGHSKPHEVRYWGLGNEVYGPWEIGAMSADEYVRRARELAKGLLATDSDIELISSGELGWSEWDRVVIDGLAAVVQWHSIHIYTGSEDYHRNVLMPHQVERALDLCRALIERTRYLQRIAHPVHIAYDEWNQWFRQSSVAHHEERYSLADALAVATFLNAFVRHSGSVRMANLAQMVNVIAPIVTSPDGLFLQTIYHPLRLFAEHMQGAVLDVAVDAPTIDLRGREPNDGGHRVADLGPFPVLDVSATVDGEERLLTMATVNRDRNHAIATEIAMPGLSAEGEATVYEVNGGSPEATNSFEQPEAVAVTGRQLRWSGGLRHLFPAHSITVMRIPLSRSG